MCLEWEDWERTKGEWGSRLDEEIPPETVYLNIRELCVSDGTYRLYCSEYFTSFVDGVNSSCRMESGKLRVKIYTQETDTDVQILSSKIRMKLSFKAV